jgi:uncharacterized protein (DUF983 family)
MPSLLVQLFKPRCPACGRGRLFRDLLSINDSCGACGLVLKHHDAADGPTFFALVIVGFVVTGMAAYVEIHYSPALWIHAALWIPLTFALCILCLRGFKAILITLEYRLALLKQNDPHK